MYDSNEQELKTLEQKIEDATLKLLSIDQQYANVQKFHQAEQSSIEQLQPIKADLEKAVTDLKDLQKATIEDISELQKTKLALTSDVEDMKVQLAKAEDDINVMVANYTEKEKLLQDKLDSADSRGNAVTIRELAVEEKEKALEAKHQAVKELAAKL